MPEPETDKFRESPKLSVGLEKPAYPIREYVYMTDDEVYQFRRPDVAYNDGSNLQDIPDGCQSDGTQPRHWGETFVSHEDNTDVIRHNDDHPGFSAVESKVEGEGYSEKAAGAIVASAARKASPAAKKANPNLKKVK
jgi:hypothetical protein